MMTVLMLIRQWRMTVLVVGRRQTMASLVAKSRQITAIPTAKIQTENDIGNDHKTIKTSDTGG